MKGYLASLATGFLGWFEGLLGERTVTGLEVGKAYEGGLFL